MLLTLDVSIQVARVGEAPPAEVRMRARTEAQILLHRPVFEVVARLAPGTREVRNFILRVARLFEQLDRCKVLLRLFIVVGDAQGVFFAVERRALLDLEPVAGKVLRLKSDGRLQVFPPVRHCLLG